MGSQQPLISSKEIEWIGLQNPRPYWQRLYVVWFRESNMVAAVDIC